MSKLRILFVCGKNQWRSPTAEKIYRNDPRVEVRSAGTSRRSRRTVHTRDIEWADLVLVMERAYGTRLRETFRKLNLPNIGCLDIPDEFQFMDADLIDRVRMGTEPYITDLQI